MPIGYSLLATVLCDAFGTALLDPVIFVQYKQLQVFQAYVALGHHVSHTSRGPDHKLWTLRQSQNIIFYARAMDINMACGTHQSAKFDSNLLNRASKFPRRCQRQYLPESNCTRAMKARIVVVEALKFDIPSHEGDFNWDYLEHCLRGREKPTLCFHGNT